jgi:uncharacterized membrane protein YebE (DUF533 family)
MARPTLRPEFTPEQQAAADALREHLLAAVAGDIDGLAELLATKTDRDLFGATEFQVRGLVLAIGAKALQAAADLRKKGATTGAPAAAPAAASPPSSSGGNPSGW